MKKLGPSNPTGKPSWGHNMMMKSPLFSILTISIFIFLILSGFKWQMIFRMCILKLIATGKRITVGLISLVIKSKRESNCHLLSSFLIKIISSNLNMISLKRCMMAMQMASWHLRMEVKVQVQVQLNFVIFQCLSNTMKDRKYGIWELTSWTNMFYPSIN